MSAPPRHILAVILKFPEPGRVKTRLAAEIGDEQAAAVYHELVAQTLCYLPWEYVDVWLCFDPPERSAEVQAWLTPMIPFQGRAQFVPQSSGDLGDRMRAVMEAAFRQPDTASLTFVGTDCPDMRWPVLVIRQRMRDENIDAVFGATLDGGYYLLAMWRPCPELFRNIPWSTEHTLSASLEAAELAGLKVHLLKGKLRDIDTLDDLQHWRTNEHYRSHDATSPAPPLHGAGVGWTYVGKALSP